METWKKSRPELHYPPSRTVIIPSEGAGSLHPRAPPPPPPRHRDACFHRWQKEGTPGKGDCHMPGPPGPPSQCCKIPVGVVGVERGLFTSTPYPTLPQARAASSRCLHDETHSLSLLGPPFSQLPPNLCSSSLTLPSPQDPQPLQTQTFPLKQGPLLLNPNPAQYCHAVWGDLDNPNYHRYEGEICLEVKKGGPGIQNTDFLYVWVVHTSKCHQEGRIKSNPFSWLCISILDGDFCITLVPSFLPPPDLAHGYSTIVAPTACCQLDEDRPLADTTVYCTQLPSLSASSVLADVQVRGAEGCTVVCHPRVILSFPTHSGLGCHYLRLDKRSCSPDPTMEGPCRFKPLIGGNECKKGNGFPPGAENPHGEIYQLSRRFLANLTSQLLPGDETRPPSRMPHVKEAELTGCCCLHQCLQRAVYKVLAEGSSWAPCLPGKAIQMSIRSGLAAAHWQKCLETNEVTNAITYKPVSLSIQDLLFQLSLGLVGPPGDSLGKEEETLTEAVLQALVSREGTGSPFMRYIHSPLITTSLVFAAHMWKSPGCQGSSVGMLTRALTFTLQKKPLEVHYGGAILTIKYSK
ncbi:LOW QUALITY PROTEIN: ciliated left-right organizer metallopeptidase [Dama dama]